MMVIWQLVIGLLLWAQGSGTGTVCTLAYADQNLSGKRDGGDSVLTDVSISLKQGELVIANLFVDGSAAGKPVCFRNLLPGEYTIAYNAPVATPVNAPLATVNVKADARIDLEFGAYMPPEPTLPTTLTIPLTRPVRIGLGLSGAVTIVIFMTGLGLVVHNAAALLAMLTRRRPKPATLRPVEAGSAGVARARLTQESPTYERTGNTGRIPRKTVSKGSDYLPQFRRKR
jgi:hypothetical protein